jgi:hypothetical protein
VLARADKLINETRSFTFVQDKFWIADPSALLRTGFRSGKKSYGQHIAETIFEFLRRQSEIKNLW